MLVAVVVGLSPTALAVAHGHAHGHHTGTPRAMHGEAHLAVQHEEPSHELHEHGLHTRGPGAASHDGVVHAAPSAALFVGHDDHAHPRVDVAAASRADVRLEMGEALDAPAPAVLTLPPEQQSRVAWLLDVAPARAGPAGTPPPRLRAPPAR